MAIQITRAAQDRLYLFPKPYADFVQRFRVASGFLLLLALALGARPTARSIVIGLPVSCLGLALRGWAGGHLAKNERLIVHGPYAWLRNPLYVGTLIAAAGVVLASRSLALTGLFAAVFAFVYLPAVELEEQHLRSLFPAYATYAKSVNRFVPRRPSVLTGQKFSWSLYRRNEEWKAVGGFLLVLGLLAWRTGKY